MNTKGKQMNHVSNSDIFHVRKTDISTKEFFVTKIFFVLVNLLTSSFTLGLHSNYLTHYWKSSVYHYTFGVTGGQGHNF